MSTTLVVQQETDTFLRYVEEWLDGLKPFNLQDEIEDPAGAAVFSADMVVGFCREGALASERIDALTQPVVRVFQRAYDVGVRDFVLLQDTHHESTPEFNSFPRHCVVGSEESQAISELRELPFYDRCTIVEKNSLHPAVMTGFDSWLDERPGLRDCIVVGDCTDLCAYHLAMHLRMRANALDAAEFRVIVPANAVDTYDLPTEQAGNVGAPAHPGDFFHRVFLYHMALNGIEVVREVV